MLGGKVACPLPVEAVVPARIQPSEIGGRVGGVSVMAIVEGVFPAGRLATALGLDLRTVTWIRPDGYEQDAQSMSRLAGAAREARSECDDSVLLVVTNSASELGTSSLVGESSAILLYEGAAPRPLEDRRWWQRVQRRPTWSDPQAVVTDVTLPWAVETAERHRTTVEQTVLADLMGSGGHRPAVLDALLRASAAGMQPTLGELAGRVRGPEGLVVGCIAGILGSLSPQARSALLLAAQLGYAHESLPALAPCFDEIDRQPWWEHLEGGWCRIGMPWRRALRAWVGSEAEQWARAVRLIGELEQLGATAEAVDIGLRAGLPAVACQVLADHADCCDRLLRQSDWWRPELPHDVLARHPALARAHDDNGQSAAHPLASLVRAADALGDGRPATASWYASAAADAARRVGAGRIAKEARVLRAAARRVRLTRSSDERVRRILWAAGLAAGFAHPEFGLRPGEAPSVAGVPSSTASASGRRPVRFAGAGGQMDRTPEPVHDPPTPSGSRTGRPVLESRLLGAMEVLVEGIPVVRWTGQLGRSVLAYVLSAHPNPVPRGRLLAAFWPGVPAKSARNRLHVALHDLRKDLAMATPSQVIEHHDGCYRVSTGIEVITDVAEVAALLRAAADVDAATPVAAAESLRLAIAVYRGEFCEDCPYDEWALAEREYHRSRRFEATLRLARLHLRTTDPLTCIDICWRLLGEDRLNEEAHQMIMRARARLGQHHLALRQFDRFRRELRAELGMAPDRSTDDLHEAIRRRERV